MEQTDITEEKDELVEGQSKSEQSMESIPEPQKVFTARFQFILTFSGQM